MRKDSVRLTRAATWKALHRIGIGGLALIWGLPFWVLGIWFLTQSWYFPDGWPQQWSLGGWQRLLSSGSQVGSGFGQSLSIALITTLLALLLGIPAGRVLGRQAVPAWIRLILLLPIITSPLAVVMGMQGVLIRLRLEGTLLGVLLVHLIPVIPYMALVMGSVFSRFDSGYEAQARSLGADPWQVWWQVTLPLVAPGMAIGAVFAFLISWNEFLLTFLIGGGRVLTLPMLLYSLLQGGNNTWVATVAILSVLPGWLALLGVSVCLGQAVGLSPTEVKDGGS
ncbi:ABC transporter permease subunit [Synechococcus sp. Nb3U1]|nr:ABC transporter permease subunit [Synechococcus sp. Nb3U1]